MTTRASASAPVFALSCPKIPALQRHLVRCGKPTCRCARGELHQSWRMVWRERGRHRRRYVPRRDVAQVQVILSQRRQERRLARLEAEQGMDRYRAYTRLLRELQREFGV